MGGHARAQPRGCPPTLFFRPSTVGGGAARGGGGEWRWCCGGQVVVDRLRRGTRSPSECFGGEGGGPSHNRGGALPNRCVCRPPPPATAGDGCVGGASSWPVVVGTRGGESPTVEKCRRGKPRRGMRVIGARRGPMCVPPPLLPNPSILRPRPRTARMGPSRPLSTHHNSRDREEGWCKGDEYPPPPRHTAPRALMLPPLRMNTFLQLTSDLNPGPHPPTLPQASHAHPDFKISGSGVVQGLWSFVNHLFPPPDTAPRALLVPLRVDTFPPTNPRPRPRTSPTATPQASHGHPDYKIWEAGWCKGMDYFLIHLFPPPARPRALSWFLSVGWMHFSNQPPTSTSDLTQRHPTGIPRAL